MRAIHVLCQFAALGAMVIMGIAPIKVHYYYYYYYGQSDQHWNCFKGNIGTVSRATLERFLGKHWNCFKGNIGTVSMATLELFQGQQWNCF